MSLHSQPRALPCLPRSPGHKPSNALASLHAAWRADRPAARSPITRSPGCHAGTPKQAQSLLLLSFNSRLARALARRACRRRWPRRRMRRPGGRRARACPCCAAPSCAAYTRGGAAAGRLHMMKDLGELLCGLLRPEQQCSCRCGLGVRRCTAKSMHAQRGASAPSPPHITGTRLHARRQDKGPAVAEFELHSAPCHERFLTCPAGRLQQVQVSERQLRAIICDACCCAPLPLA